MTNPFVKMVEDIVREQLLTMGHDFGIIVDRVEEQRDGEGCIVRMNGEVDDLRIIPPDDDPSPASITVQVRRKLDIALRGVAPFKTQAF